MYTLLEIKIQEATCRITVKFATLLSRKPAISPKYYCIHLDHVFFLYTCISTAFTVLAFVKIMLSRCKTLMFLMFVKWVFFFLPLNNEITKMLICESLLSYQSHTEWRSKLKMSAVA